MKVSRLKSFLLNYYLHQPKPRVSILLLGAPGVGKSWTVRAVAEELANKLNKEFVDYSDDVAPKILAEPERYFVFCDLRLTETEPSDLIGIPRIVDDAVQYKPLLWARCLSKTAGILFLDELTNVQRPDVISASYKLLLDRRAGFTPFHEDVLVIAAGNAPEHSAIANMLPCPLINRLVVINVAPPSVDDWMKFMLATYGDEWDKRTLGFLKAFETEGYLLRCPREVETLINYPTPRTWTFLSLLLRTVGENDDMIIGLLGEEVGQKFRAFIRTKVDINDLISHPEKFLGLNIDQQYMGTMMLATWLSKHTKQWSKAFKLISTMASVSRDLIVLLALLIPTKAMLTKLLTALSKAGHRDVIDALSKVIKLKEQL